MNSIMNKICSAQNITWYNSDYSLIAKAPSYSSFPIFIYFLPNPGRILPVLTFNGCDPLHVNAGRILPGFGRKLRNIGKLDCFAGDENFNCW